MARSERQEIAALNDRRDFLKATAGVAALTGLAMAGGVHAAGAEIIKVGIIGCGGRGSGAIENACDADPRVRVVALADVFKDRLAGLRDHLRKERKNQFTATDEHCFIGFDAFKKLLAIDMDYVILATPPHFRPEHLAAAIAAGKNVFMEKPVAVDAMGCRSVMESGDLAKTKGLSIVAGTQRRHEKCYLEAVDRIRNGAIGNIISARCYWTQGELWHRDRGSGWSDMEWMIRDWVNWLWLSGDHICEQHVHNLDVINWFTGKHPVRAVGYGGRHQRKTGDQFDFFAVDYEFEDGMHNSSYCRQFNGGDSNQSEVVVGEKGTCRTMSGFAEINAAEKWRFKVPPRGKKVNPYVQEHVDLIDSIVNKKGLNEAHNIATSTLTAVMGRMAAYSAEPITWERALADNTKLGPASYDWQVSLMPRKPAVPGLP